jgi:Predicted redox protein, regulator of disulfide bond formation
MAQVTVKPVAGHAYQLTADTGSHKIIIDQPVPTGSGGGPDPKETFLAGLAACAAQTILMKAPQRKWDIQELTVTVTLTYPNGAKGTPVFDEKIEVKGNLTQAELDAIKRGAERCPVYELFVGAKTVNTAVVKLP